MLGVGAGWYEQEYLTYGYQFPDKTTRREEFAEALEIIKPMTNGKDVHFKGKFFSAEAEAAASVKKTHMIIGGRHPTTVKLAAKYADELNIYGPTPDEVARFRSILDTAVPKNKVQISLTVPLVIAENRRSLIAGMKAFRTSNGKTGDTEKAIEEAKKDGMLCGTPEEVSTAIRARYAAGISRFYLQVGDLRTTAMADLLTQTLKDL
jgi:alkanesulfonate monooxygenase SsuD/methylene tetrahydromethanopterin reductase-like flavin-dependent oxidoreductase (luciferase family)